MGKRFYRNGFFFEHVRFETFVSYPNKNVKLADDKLTSLSSEEGCQLEL